MKSLFSGVIPLFETPTHTCNYYPDRHARQQVIDPSSPHLGSMYVEALENGFRRSGHYMYRPNCPGCQACVSYRIPVEQFQPDRSQRRNIKHNRELEITCRPAIFTDEYFDLFRCYVDTRHPRGGMENPTIDDFTHFLIAPWRISYFLEFRLERKLLAVAVTDICAPVLSAVYTFYDPDYSTRGLGTYAILKQIEWARSLSIPYLYLGYWIEGHRKMDYKKRFKPGEIFSPSQQKWMQANTACIPPTTPSTLP